ncbi:MAG: DUF2798 domain-containing protein [Oceanospirillaceae bacterium]
MSLLLSSLMTAWVTWLNLGWSVLFYQQWLHAFMLAWPAAALISLFCAPTTYRVSIVLSDKIQKKLISKRLI